jgi:hypothetical protein
MPHPEQPSYEELAAQNTELTGRVAEQAALIESLRAEVAALRRQAGRDCVFSELWDNVAVQEAVQPRRQTATMSGTVSDRTSAAAWLHVRS